MFEKIVGLKIKQAIKEAGFTQEEFAKLLHTHQAVIQNWIMEIRKPKPETLKKISELTKKPLNFFIDNKNSVNIAEVKDNATININQRDYEQMKKEIELLKREIEIEKKEKELLQGKTDWDKLKEKMSKVRLYPDDIDSKKNKDK